MMDFSHNSVVFYLGGFPWSFHLLQIEMRKIIPCSHTAFDVNEINELKIQGKCIWHVAKLDHVKHEQIQNDFHVKSTLNIYLKFYLLFYLFFLNFSQFIFNFFQLAYLDFRFYFIFVYNTRIDPKDISVLSRDLSFYNTTTRQIYYHFSLYHIYILIFCLLKYVLVRGVTLTVRTLYRACSSQKLPNLIKPFLVIFSCFP